MSALSFHVVNLGCKVNRVESDAAAAALIARGAAPVSEREADLVIVNTCTVTGEAEKKTRKAVRHALRANDRARVVVTGCAAAIDPAFFEALDARVEVVQKAELLARCAAYGGAGASRAAAPSLLRTGEAFPTRVGVKVQDGCDNACTYCIVHVARGRATSRPADEVAAECRALAAAGVREIVLTGINLGSYCDGPRRDAASLRLHDLLARLLDETAPLHDPGEPACRFRISSIEPRDVAPELIELMAAAEGRICRHLHLPLQAGSTKVLREMARPYTAEEYRALVGRLYAVMPSLALSTDIIAGFPGETEGEFEETLALARACRFAKIHAFPYSQREGTPAAARTDQVDPQVKTERTRRLIELGDTLRHEAYEGRHGTRELVLVEGDGRGMTESYFEIPVDPALRPGSLVELVL